MIQTCSRCVSGVDGEYLTVIWSRIDGCLVQHGSSHLQRTLGYTPGFLQVQYFTSIGYLPLLCELLLDQSIEYLVSLPKYIHN